MNQRMRCGAVWLTASLGAALLLPWLTALTLSPSTTFPGLLTRMCAAAGAACTAWLWCLTTVTTLEAARGRARLTATGVRRLVLLACGVALISGTALPSYAAGPAGPHPPTAAQRVQGLPLPELPTTAPDRLAPARPARATNPAPAPPVHRTRAEPTTPRRSTARPHTVIVRTGDTLWSIATAVLVSRGAATDDAAVAAACARLYELNAAVVGSDPDHIEPGQELRIPLSEG